MAGRAAHMYDRECVIYLAKSVQIAKAGLARWQALSMVGDEARCSNLQIMTLFLSVPIASDITYGFLAPHQINPDLHVDLGAHSISARIGDALNRAATGLPCSKKPEADPLVSTWHVCQCLDNALVSTMASGLYHFQPVVQMPRLAPGEKGVFSRSTAGRWRISVETSDGPVHQWLLPSPWARSLNYCRARMWKALTQSFFLFLSFLWCMFVLTPGSLGPLWEQTTDIISVVVRNIKY
jgi:hypothetical protein